MALNRATVSGRGVSSAVGREEALLGLGVVQVEEELFAFPVAVGDFDSVDVHESSAF